MKAAFDYSRVPDIVKCENAPDLVRHLQRVSWRWHSFAAPFDVSHSGRACRFSKLRPARFPW